MNQEYNYNYYLWIKKLLISLAIIIAGFLIDRFIPTDTTIQRLLIYFIYFSGGVLLLFDALPLLYRTITAPGRGIILSNRSLIIKKKNIKDNFAINKVNIEKVEFNSPTMKKFTIYPDRKLENIDEGIYKIMGRRLEISYREPNQGQQKYTIYLELLDNEFLEEFIKWFQGDVVIRE